MKLATAGSRLSRRWKTEEWYWEALVKRLRTPARTGETVAEYARMSKDEKTAKKDVGGFVGGALRGGRRVAGSVTERWLVTLDADYAEPGDWDTYACLNDWRCCVYSTHSHTPEHPKLRWILPLKRAVSPEEYVAVARKVAEWIGIEKMDPLTYQPERLMFWPSCCEDGVYEFHEQDGPPLDPDRVLREYGPDEAWRDASLWPTSSREGEVVQREAKHQADPLTKPGLVGAFCRVYSVQDAIDAFDLPYERCDGVAGERYTYTHGSTAAGAVVYGDGRWLYSNHATDPAGGMLCNAWDLVRVHRFADLDVDSRATEVTKLPSWARMVELVSTDARVRAAVIDSQFGDMGNVGSIAPVSESTNGVKKERVDKTGKPSTDGEDVSKNDGVDEADDTWKAKLTMDRKTGTMETTLNNACLILSESPVFRGRLAYCKMGGQIYVTDEMPWPHRDKGMTPEEEKLLMGPDWLTTSEIYAQKGYHGPPRMAGRVWDRQDQIELYKMFERMGYSVGQTHNGILDNAVVDSSYQMKKDPISDYLKELRWDGTERLDTMFIRWLGAEDCELNREITRLWMMGAVDRALRPGCQFDSVLVFCGEQGIGKTSLLRMLAGDYYTNAVDATAMTKQTGELLQGKWIVELGELDSVKKSSSTAFKNFITATTDHYRKAYATDAETFPRQCVFAATTNEGAFLRDDTGERRFWIMPCAGQKGMAAVGKKGTLPGFAEEVEQLWAEAMDMWRRRMREKRKPGDSVLDVNLYLYITDPALEQEMEDRRQGFKLPDSTAEDIKDYLDKPRPDNWESMTPDARIDFFRGYWIGDPECCTYLPDTVTLKEIRTELYRETPEEAARRGRSGMASKITSVMNSLPGWERVQRDRKGSDASGRWRRVRKA